MSIVGKDIEVLDSFFEMERKKGALQERKIQVKIVMLGAIGGLLLGANIAGLFYSSKLIASETKASSPFINQEIPTLPASYDFMAPMSELPSNPLETPPTFTKWDIVS